MALFTISDLHLSLSIDKPMDIFGENWKNYMQRIADNWNDTVSDGDLVIIGGDISWAMYLDECFKDFEYIDKLPGKKVILKGNHDYFWESMTKLKKYIADNNFSTIDFIHNSSISFEGVSICGTRGWIDPSYDSFKEDDEKIYKRELARLELSLQSAKKYNNPRTIVVLHYPPVTSDKSVNQDYAAIFKKYDVSMCIYGHLHSKASKCAFEGIHDGVLYKLVSADYLNFTPYKITF